MPVSLEAGKGCKGASRLWLCRVEAESYIGSRLLTVGISAILVSASCKVTDCVCESQIYCNNHLVSMVLTLYVKLLTASCTPHLHCSALLGRLALLPRLFVWHQHLCCLERFQVNVRVHPDDWHGLAFIWDASHVIIDGVPLPCHVPTSDRSACVQQSAQLPSSLNPDEKPSAGGAMTYHLLAQLIQDGLPHPQGEVVLLSSAPNLFCAQPIKELMQRHHNLFHIQILSIATQSKLLF